ncbi:50S ribosomal protein L4 [Candidatus Saccharibacteria bacterium]|nr:50S ribosomal protein L4 [Candidatus Saccharibacteria bacterium]MBI2285642.1 50S ribosomal protein L4 [Candidatus Saccharibacteria bacterium]
MSAVETFTKSGSKASTPAKLDKSVFGLKVEDHQLLKEAYLANLANKRPNLAKAKKRGEVRGGGAKPWRQKGTGRARAGSIRSPIWAGGGVTFGPTGEENYSRKINTKAKRLALRQALSMAAEDGKIKVVDSFNFADGRVKTAQAFLDKIKAGGNTLLVIEQKEPMVERATRNLPLSRLVQARYLTVLDILNVDTIVVDKKALEQIESWLGGKSG